MRGVCVDERHFSLLVMSSYATRSRTSFVLLCILVFAPAQRVSTTTDALDFDDDVDDAGIAALPVPPLPRLLVASLRPWLTAAWAEERQRANAAVTAGSTTERRRQRMEQVGVGDCLFFSAGSSRPAFKTPHVSSAWCRFIEAQPCGFLLMHSLPTCQSSCSFSCGVIRGRTAVVPACTLCAVKQA